MNNKLYYGINQINNEDIFIKNNNGDMQHELIIGSVGSGKTYLCKEKIKEIYKKSEDKIIILGGKYSEYNSISDIENIKVIDTTKFYWNPLRIDFDIREQDKNRKITFIFKILNCICDRELSPYQKYLIDSIMRSIYKYNNNPTFLYLLSVMKKHEKKDELKNVIFYLQENLKDRLGKFNNDNLDTIPDCRVVVLDMNNEEKKDIDLVTLILLEAVEQQVCKNYKKEVQSHIIIDSVDLLTQKNDMVFLLLGEIIRRLRTKAGEITLLLSNVSFLEHQEFVNILPPIIRIRLLRQANYDIETLSKKFKLSEEECFYLTNTNRGEGLIIEHNNIPFIYKKQ